MTDIKPVVTDLPSPAPDSPLEALSWLGDTVEEIAEGLRARGIKGHQNAGFSCPIHNYLATFGWDTYADNPYCWLGDPMFTRDRFDTPAPVGEFINRFDDGKFPDLIEP